jgi:hypothetical protein
MPLLVAAGVLLVLAIVFGPQLWVRSVLRRHAADRPDFPGTGGELARHLLDLGGLKDVPVETTPAGDHYDPVDRVVRLAEANHDGRSITAVAVAAHEVSHALQHADGNPLIAHRVRLATIVRQIEIAAAVVLAAAPVMAALTRSPALLAIQAAVVVILLASRVVMHVATLPLELDASFGRALPVLDKGGFLSPSDLPAARQVLRAASLTYVASALLTLLDVTRLFRILRF